MALHLLKLCVGIDSFAELEAHQARRKRPLVHLTRMTPRRGEELLDGGSLYWVIKGQIAARQGLRAIESFVDSNGTGRCRLVLDPLLVRVASRPFRAFQGWRYLAAADCPPDLASGTGADLPEELRAELSALGLL